MASGTYTTTYRADLKLVRTNWLRGWIVVLVAFLAYLPFVLKQKSLFGIDLTPDQLLGMSVSRVDFALIAVIGAVGLNFLTGYTGLISIGNAAFFAIGALAASVVGNQLHLPFPLAVAAGGLAGAGVGVVVGLPALRVRGLYLLLTTMGLHFIAVYCFLRYQQTFFGSASGGVGYPDASVGPWRLRTDIDWYFLLLGVVVLFLVATKNILRTREGRAMMAVRDQDIAAGAVGVNVGLLKVKAFAASSFIVSVAGALFAYYLTNVGADTFSMLFAIEYAAMIIIGGLGSLLGSVLGALLWTLLPNLLNALTTGVDPATPMVGPLLAKNQPEVADILLGLVIIAMLIFKPEGLAGIVASLRRYFRQWPFTT